MEQDNIPTMEWSAQSPDTVGENLNRNCVNKYRI